MDTLYQIDSLANPADYPDAQPNPDDPYVDLSWFCAGRSEPIAPYATLIAGYDRLEAAVKGDAERFMDEWFTREEVTRLLPYLCFEFGHAVRLRALPVPMDIFLATGESIATPIEPLLASGMWRIAYTLSDQEADYPLPFPVSAYYAVIPADTSAGR